MISTEVFVRNLLTSVERRYVDIVSRMISVPPGADRRLEEGRVYETVFRDWIQSDKLKRSVFIRVDSKDPSDEFMARFATVGRTVNKASEAYFDYSTLRGPLDRSTGQRGILLSVTSIKWVFGDRVEVNASLNCGSLCGKGGVYRLVKKRGHWTVEAYENRYFY